jgi:hypothetical protein
LADFSMPHFSPEDLDLSSQDESRDECQTEAEDALYAWRANYDRRRTTRKVVNWSKRGVRVLAVGAAALLALFVLRAPSTEPEAAPLEIQTQEALGSQAAQEVLPAAPTWDIGIIDGTKKVWSLDDTEWIQFDYAMQAPVFLQWSDETGATALNSLECTNKLRGGLRRCYIGRSHGRIGIALDQGVQPGTWNVEACTQPEGGICMDLGAFSVNQPE